jgi:hypothetical protein
MKLHQRLRMVEMALVGLALLAAPLPAFSQSCALCYSQAASAGGRMIAALRSGILIMMVPPMCMSVGFTILAYRKRNRFAHNEPDESDNEIRKW